MGCSMLKFKKTNFIENVLHFASMPESCQWKRMEVNEKHIHFYLSSSPRHTNAFDENDETKTHIFLDMNKWRWKFDSFLIVWWDKVRYCLPMLTSLSLSPYLSLSFLSSSIWQPWTSHVFFTTQNEERRMKKWREDKNLREPKHILYAVSAVYTTQ